MISSSHIAVEFGAAIEAFTPIVGQPKYNDLQGVRKVLLHTYLSICLAGSKSEKVTGLVLPDAAYKNQPGVKISFEEYDTPLNEYDLSVAQDTEAWEQQKLQALWNTRFENQYRIQTMKHGCRLFVLHASEAMHCISLCNKDTYYKMVSPIKLLAHSAEEIRGLEVTDVVALIGELPGYCNSNP